MSGQTKEGSAAPSAWEVDWAWKHATLDAEELLAGLKANAHRARCNLTRHSAGWGSRTSARHEADAAATALRDLERVADLLRWLRAQPPWIDPETTGNQDTNDYADPPFRYCPPGGCADPVACGQAMSCGRCDSDAKRNGTFHELPMCV